MFRHKHQMNMAFPNRMSTTSYMVVLSHDTKCRVNGMKKRYRYRAYPTGEQAHAIARLFGCVRVVWNDALATRERARKAGEPFIKRGELSALLTASKKTPERSWLTEVSSVPLQQSLVHLERAYTNFFNSLTGVDAKAVVSARRISKGKVTASQRNSRKAPASQSSRPLTGWDMSAWLRSGISVSISPVLCLRHRPRWR